MNGYYTTDETVNVAKRDLSTAGTKITVNTLSGQIPTDIAVSKLADYLTFTGVEGSDLSAIKNSSKEYTLIVKMLMVQTLNSLKRKYIYCYSTCKRRWKLHR